MHYNITARWSSDERRKWNDCEGRKEWFEYKGWGDEWVSDLVDIWEFMTPYSEYSCDQLITSVQEDIDNDLELDDIFSKYCNHYVKGTYVIKPVE
tara:strand:- start:29 stop:313 length:285 start_codon:yes stop_codon:yes gene_type:complete